MDRYTVKDAEHALERLCEVMHKQYSKTYSREIGVYTLNNEESGGVVIHEYTNTTGGVREPFGTGRVTPRVFCERVNFAIRMLDESSPI